jgi:hypothetical protein
MVLGCLVFSVWFLVFSEVKTIQNLSLKLVIGS